MTTYFPATEGYGVAPQTFPESNLESIDFSVTFVVLEKDVPVFFLEVKAPANLRMIARRQSADAQMRSRFHSILNQCPLEELHGICAFGTHIATM
uniref:Uncharacterized protein n=1 Tax=Arcella intermedia TaxID=1963864 RepID=A0A6B2LTP0_9EUKA